MRKALVIIFAVAVLGILAATVSPLSAKTSKQPTNNTSANPVAPPQSVSQQSAQQATIQNTDTVPTTPQATVPATKTYKDGTYHGTLESNRYDDIKVSLTISGGKISTIGFDTLTTHEDRSDEINSFAIPQLKQQTLAAQNANIDGVSGASYTSQAYINSLQAALDQAKI